MTPQNHRSVHGNVMLRGGPRDRWAYTEKSWVELRDSVRRQLARGQKLVDDVLHYKETRETAVTATDEPATVWRWSR